MIGTDGNDSFKFTVARGKPFKYLESAIYMCTLARGVYIIIDRQT